MPSAYLLPGSVIVTPVTALFTTVAVPVAVTPVLSGGAVNATVGSLVYAEPPFVIVTLKTEFSLFSLLLYPITLIIFQPVVRKVIPSITLFHLLPDCA